MKATIRDVARRAGVSIATVSRVLNATTPVAEDKRRRVVAAAEALGYTPNEVARSLLGKATGGLGVLLPSVSGEFFSEFLNGLDRATHQNGFFLMISTSHRNLDEMSVALKSLHRRVDGLITMAPEGDAAQLRALLPERAPCVLVNTDAEGLACDAFNFDNYRGGFLATEHLLSLGHRRIAMLKGPARAFDARERLRGYRAALRAYGQEPAPELEITGDYTSEAGKRAAETLLAMDPRPTAVFAANDQSALALIGALQNEGLSVPEALSVVGFDDIPSVRYASPPLTSIHVPIRDVAMRAVERLVERVRDRHAVPQQRVLPVELVVRQSTAPPS